MRTIGLGRCRLCTAHVHAAGEPSWTGQPLLRPRGVCVARKEMHGSWAAHAGSSTLLD